MPRNKFDNREAKATLGCLKDTHQPVPVQLLPREVPLEHLLELLVLARVPVTARGLVRTPLVEVQESASELEPGSVPVPVVVVVVVPPRVLQFARRPAWKTRIYRENGIYNSATLVRCTI